MLWMLQTRRVLRLTSQGRLVPWLGPALRGLVARGFKEAVCRFSWDEQQTTWKYCKGCPHMTGCSYGRTFEADPPASMTFRGQDDGTRPIVLAPEFPLPQRSYFGMEVSVYAHFFGLAAAAEAEALWTAVSRAGLEGGLGEDQIGFSVEAAEPDRWCWIDLPRDRWAVCGEWPSLRVELTSPLLLRRGATEQSRREMILDPSFADLFRAGLRILGALCRGYGTPAEADFAGLREAAEQVPTIRRRWQRFTQGKWSNRSGQYAEVRGVVGEAEFGPVPAALVRWLIHAGRAHVGQHRVAGAGSWRVYGRPSSDVDWQELT
jgi:hypothetical protein